MKHIIEFQDVGVDKKIKHTVDMNMPMPKKHLSQHSIWMLVKKSIDEELGDDEAKYKIDFGNLNDKIINISTIRNMQVRWQKVLNLLQFVKKQCYIKYPIAASILSRKKHH